MYQRCVTFTCTIFCCTCTLQDCDVCDRCFRHVYVQTKSYPPRSTKLPYRSPLPSPLSPLSRLPLPSLNCPASTLPLTAHETRPHRIARNDSTRLLSTQVSAHLPKHCTATLKQQAASSTLSLPSAHESESPYLTHRRPFPSHPPLSLIRPLNGASCPFRPDLT
ncbi:hypothetical protein AC579_4416 [Pseudocercospora musae]|uniref:Uncharacterized protein n=1 Tax=Pseudocercospora musae TaxID=113226 RepID=A0A139IJ72_9PEZI|nr:hypothetical protein AC579_4416 [Pseudocercospora musae]